MKKSSFVNRSSLLFVDLVSEVTIWQMYAGFREVRGRMIVADPIHGSRRQRFRRAEPKDEIERFFAATIAKSSSWQKANRDQCLVTQSIRIALTRRN